MASMPGARQVMAPASPRSDAASGHDTDTPGAGQLGKRKYSHTTAAQRQTLLQWLELPGNFDLLTKPVSAVKINNEQAIAASSSSSSPPPPKRVKKTEGYRSLAQYMNRVALTDWSEKTARSRFESFMSAYRKAKRQNPPDQLPTFYQRVDALFGPDGDRELARFRSESVGQRSEGSRSPLLTRESEAVFQELSIATPLSRALSEGQEVSSPPRRRARLPETRPEPVVSKVEVAEELAASSPVKEVAATPAVNDQSVQQETQRLTASVPTVNDQAESQRVASASDQLESQRLAVKQQELELKQSELRAKQEESRQKLRAEVLTKLVEAGKSPAEVREYLAIMDPVDNLPSRP